MAAEGGTVLITGANRGLGLEMVRQLVECDKPAKRVFACCRDPKGAPAEVRVFTSGVVSELLNKRKVLPLGIDLFNCKVPATDGSEIGMTAPAIKNNPRWVGFFASSCRLCVYRPWKLWQRSILTSPSSAWVNALCFSLTSRHLLVLRYLSAALTDPCLHFSLSLRQMLPTWVALKSAPSW